jgi:NADP-dependent 3-hydroxy acid dehydrogenase YdfG
MADELGAKEGKTIFIQADLTESEAIQNLINKSVEAFGRIDILVTVTTLRQMSCR